MTNFNALKWKISSLESKINKLETEVSDLKKKLKLERARKWRNSTFLTSTQRNSFIRS
jgi:predicted  nucleic acid-binding Zn-ribbon protein